jgi:hypothetical protein
LLAPLKDFNSTSNYKEISILLVATKDFQLCQHHQEILTLPAPPKILILQLATKIFQLCQ